MRAELSRAGGFCREEQLLRLVLPFFCFPSPVGLRRGPRLLTRSLSVIICRLDVMKFLYFPA